jgi:putrescine aminotransferase
VPFGDAEALERAIDARGRETCVILEPVQAEAGVVIPPAGYLREVAAACRAHDALLVLDEIQTGLGRVGHWWAAAAEGVVPDILLAGKVLSGGIVPVSALIATEEAFHPFSRDPLLHTSTFAGAPIAAAAAAATIAVVRDEDVPARSALLGAEIRARLRGAITDVGLDVEVRGAGLLIGLDFPATGLAGEFFGELLQRHVLASHSLNADRVVRLTPPVTLSAQDVDWLERAVRESLAAVVEVVGNTIGATA